MALPLKKAVFNNLTTILNMKKRTDWKILKNPVALTKCLCCAKKEKGCFWIASCGWRFGRNCSLLATGLVSLCSLANESKNIQQIWAGWFAKMCDTKIISFYYHTPFKEAYLKTSAHVKNIFDPVYEFWPFWSLIYIFPPVQPGFLFLKQLFYFS